jgi:2,3,4,5-tetrahydropyridine-2-carboxylate N-succinyltransferase
MAEEGGAAVFRTNDMSLVDASPAPFWDKVPSRFAGFDEAAFRALGARVVPGAVVRAGSHIGKDVVLMPSFVNIGAYVGEGTMVDTWATVGSCAQIGKHCHLSGGAGIGGVLEPLQASRRRSSKTTASSARVRKWWKASWSATTA